MSTSKVHHEQLYADYLGRLNGVIERSEQHSADEPNCPGLPICIGGIQLVALIAAMQQDGDFGPLLVSVAVHELSRARKREEALRQRLEIQRDLTAEMVSAAEDAQRACANFEDLNQSLLGKIDELENALADERERTVEQ
jgi:hypothetical protein